MSGVLGTIISVLIVGFYNHQTTPWVALGFAIDFLFRFIWGSQYSVVGMTATLIQCRFDPKWAAGPRKF